MGERPRPQEQLHCQVQPRGLQCGEKPIGHLALPGAASDGSAQTGGEASLPGTVPRARPAPARWRPPAQRARPVSARRRVRQAPGRAEAGPRPPRPAPGQARTCARQGIRRRPSSGHARRRRAPRRGPCRPGSWRSLGGAARARRRRTSACRVFHRPRARCPGLPRRGSGRMTAGLRVAPCRAAP